MYKKGAVQYGKSVIDTQIEDYDFVEAVYLPHSCDYWVIGGRKEIEDLIADLKEIMDKHFPKPLS